MNKAMTINIILIITVLILVGLLSWFLIINRADDKFNQIFSKILIALIAAIVLIGFELLAKPKPIEKKIKVLILRNKDYTNIKEFSNRLIKADSDYKNGYLIMNTVETLNINSIKQLERKYNPKQIGLDNLEYSFWIWLGNRYSMHWDIEQNYFDGISGGSGYILTAEGADKETKKITYKDLKSLLVSNQLLPTEHGQFFEIHFPKNTNVKILEDSKSRRAYEIGNKYYKLYVEMYNIGGAALTYTTLSEKIKKSLNGTDNEWYSGRLIIKMKCDFSSFRKGSPDLIKQRNWVIDIMDGLEHDFDWGNLKPELEKAYNL